MIYQIIKVIIKGMAEFIFTILFFPFLFVKDDFIDIWEDVWLEIRRKFYLFIAERVRKSVLMPKDILKFFGSILAPTFVFFVLLEFLLLIFLLVTVVEYFLLWLVAYFIWRIL
jgi:hypothetical protein